MRNKMEDLRNHLFSALEALGDKDEQVDLDRMRAISDIAQVLINSAKVEVEYLKVAGGKGTKFLQSPESEPLRLVKE